MRSCRQGGDRWPSLPSNAGRPAGVADRGSCAVVAPRAPAAAPLPCPSRPRRRTGERPSVRCCRSGSALGQSMRVIAMWQGVVWHRSRSLEHQCGIAPTPLPAGSGTARLPVVSVRPGALSGPRFRRYATGSISRLRRFRRPAGGSEDADPGVATPPGPRLLLRQDEGGTGAAQSFDFATVRA